MKPSRPAKTTHARTWSLTLCAVLLLAGATAAPAQSLKVGVVDINKVFAGYYKTRDADKKLADERARAKKDLDEQIAHHKQMLDEVTALSKAIENAALSPDAKSEQLKVREEKIRELRRFEQSLNEYRNSREKDMQDAAARTRNLIVEEIMVVINEKVESEKYDLIFNRSGASLKGLPFVVYGNDKLDFTNDVIAALNKGQPAATPGTAPAAVPATPADSPKK